MATSKKTSGRKAPAAKATAKKSAKTAAKTTAKKATRVRGGPGGHVMQIDAGWFYMHQNGYETGQVVVIGNQASSVEYYFLYQSGTSGSKAPYTWPSANNSPVTTKYTYAGSLPPNWTTPAKYQSNLYPVIAQLVTATCTMATASPRKKSPKR